MFLPNSFCLELSGVYSNDIEPHYEVGIGPDYNKTLHNTKFKKRTSLSFRPSSNFSKGKRDPHTLDKFHYSIKFQLTNLCSFLVENINKKKFNLKSSEKKKSSVNF